MIGVVACLVAAVLMAPRPAVWRAGVRQQSAIVGRLADQVARSLPRRGTYLAQVNVYDASTFGGVMAELWARGYHLVVPDDTTYYWPGARCRRRDLDGVLIFSSGAAAGSAPAGSRLGARTVGDAGPSRRLTDLVDELTRRIEQIGGVRYHRAEAERFLDSFPGATAIERRQLLPEIRHLEGYDLVTLLELDDAGVLDEPSLRPLLRRIERAGARLYGAFGAPSRAAVSLAPPAAAQGCAG